MAFRTLAAVLVLALVALAASQPCIECSNPSCTSDNCKSQCQRTCPKTVNLDKCKTAGQEAGKKVAKEACEVTEQFCKGTSRTAKALGATQVTLKQCGNIAFGECQKVAKEANSSPCGKSFNGVNQCSKDAFMSFYNSEVDERCNKEADRIEKEGPQG